MSSWGLCSGSALSLQSFVEQGFFSDVERANIISCRESVLPVVVAGVFCFDSFLVDRVWRVVRSRWAVRYHRDMSVFNDKQCLLFDYLLRHGGCASPKSIVKDLGIYRGVLSKLLSDDEYLISEGFLFKVVFRNEVRGELTDSERFVLMIHPRLVMEARRL